jgi:hypothetical protein
VRAYISFFLAFKSSWKPQKESCMALKLVWRFVNGPVAPKKIVKGIHLGFGVTPMKYK